MIYAFTIICALIPGAADGGGDCKVDAFKTNTEYVDTTVCAKDMAAALKGDEKLDEKQLDMTKGVFYNYGCVNYPTNPADDMNTFSQRIFKLFGPLAVKEDA